MGFLSKENNEIEVVVCSGDLIGPCLRIDEAKKLMDAFRYMKNRIKILCLIFLILFGVFIFIYGEYDDSPGAQGLGVLAVIGGIVGLIKNKKKTSD